MTKSKPEYPLNAAHFTPFYYKEFVQQLCKENCSPFRCLSRRSPIHYCVLDNRPFLYDVKPRKLTLNEIYLRDFLAMLDFPFINEIKSAQDLINIYDLVRSTDENSVKLGVNLLVKISNKYQIFAGLLSDTFFNMRNNIGSNYLCYTYLSTSKHYKELLTCHYSLSYFEHTASKDKDITTKALKEILKYCFNDYEKEALMFIGKSYKWI